MRLFEDIITVEERKRHHPRQPFGTMPKAPPKPESDDECHGESYQMCMLVPCG